MQGYVNVVMRIVGMLFNTSDVLRIELLARGLCLLQGVDTFFNNIRNRRHKVFELLDGELVHVSWIMRERCKDATYCATTLASGVKSHFLPFG